MRSGTDSVGTAEAEADSKIVGETQVNAITGPQRDPESNFPEYKFTAVWIRPVAR